MKNKMLLRYGGFVFSVGGARTVGILMSALTFPCLVRHLGVEMYGLWSYVVALCAFLDIIADPGLTSHVTQQVAARREAGFELISDFLVLRLLSASVATVVVLIVIFFEARPDVRQLLRLYGIGLLAVNLLSADHFLAALEMFHARSLLIVTQQAMYALAVFALVRGPRDVVWVPTSILASSAVTGLAGWAVLWSRGFRIPLVLRPHYWKGILIPSAHYALSTLMSSLYHRSGHLLVRWFLGDYALGLYAAAVRLVDLLRGFVTMVLYVLTPRLALSAKSEAGLGRLTRIAMAAMAVTSIPLTVGLMSTAHLVVPWVLGAKYSGDILLVKWMAPYLITASAASLFSGSILYATGRHRAYLAATASGAVVGVLLNVTLISRIGLTGAALAFVLAELVVAVTAYALLPQHLHDLWKSPVAGVGLAAALMMALAVRLVNVYVPQVLIVISVGAFVYFVSCGWFVSKWFHEQLGGL